jgi:phosphate transport system protein
MARQSYQELLQRLRGQVGALGDRVLDQYRTATEVLQTGDPAAAETVAATDETVNDWYLDIESDCVELLALEQPVAGDLRLVASSFKIVTDLERVGDLATNLATYGRESGGDLGTLEVGQIAALAGEMVEGAMDAYLTEDADAAREVAGQDDLLDRRCREVSSALVRELLHADGVAIDRQPEAATRALLTIRDIERVGDHAVNVCARTVYMIDHDADLLY